MVGLLEGKSALVTGGGSGIGRATAVAFAREEARVAVCDRVEEGARGTVETINGHGGQAIAIAVDVTHSDQVAAMVERVVSSFGRLDCAFNNAGVASHHVGASGLKTAEWPEESWSQMLATNLTGVWLCMKHELPCMLGQGSGVIINTASVAGLVGLQNASGYVAAKHGVIGLTKTAALEYAQPRIRINSVCPGFIETSMTEDAVQRYYDRIIATTPAGRMGQPAEIAEMVVWLCSDRASFVTGANYNVDGGYYAA